jgi:hypothetical protein
LLNLNTRGAEISLIRREAFPTDIDTMEGAVMKKRKKPSKNSRATSRPLMFLVSSMWVASILVILVFRGGGTAPVEPRPLASAPSLVLEADQLAALGQYAAAAEKYQAAVERDPDSASIRFALGTALSHVDRQGETVEQFQWVVTRGVPGSPEVEMARRWLTNAGVLAREVSFAAPTGPDREASPQAAAPAPTARQGSVAVGTVKGRTELQGQPREINLVLGSTDDAKKNMAFTKTVKLGEAFQFDNVPPGTYRLTVEDSENDTSLWDLEVTVAPGKDTVLNLGSA